MGFQIIAAHLYDTSIMYMAFHRIPVTTGRSYMLLARKVIAFLMGRLVRPFYALKPLELIPSPGRWENSTSAVVSLMEHVDTLLAMQYNLQNILTHWDRDKMDAISQTTFPSAFSWMKMFYSRLTFHWSLVLRVYLTIFQHWSDNGSAPSRRWRHYLNHWWLVYWRIYASLAFSELNAWLFSCIRFGWINYFRVQR